MSLPRVHAAPVILVCAAVLFGGAFLGFRLVTAEADIEQTAPTCESTTIAAGDPVQPQHVTVDVYNGSQRAGLANRVSINLQRRGFLPGQIGNSEIEVESNGVTIVTSTPEDPRVKLVAAQFGNVEFLEPAGSTPAENVVVVVGNDTNEDLDDDAAEQVAAEEDLTVCLPIAPEIAEGSAA